MTREEKEKIYDLAYDIGLEINKTRRQITLSTDREAKAQFNVKNVALTRYLWKIGFAFPDILQVRECMEEDMQWLHIIVCKGEWA